jgi:hypothetical protein
LQEHQEKDMNASPASFLNRRFLLVVIAACLTLAAGCTQHPRNTPVEVMVKPGTSEWVVVTAEGWGDPPNMVPIVTLVDGQKVEGLLLKPGTAEHDLVVRADGASKGRLTKIELPSKVQFKGGRWTVRIEKRLITSESLGEASSVPLSVFVPVFPLDGRMPRPVPGFKGESGEL